MAKKISLSDLDLAADAKSLKAALEKADTNKVRDPYILFDWDDAEGKNFKAGYAVLYPGCRTGGHEHDDVEEVYHVVNGNGNMYIGDEFSRLNLETPGLFLVSNIIGLRIPAIAR